MRAQIKSWYCNNCCPVPTSHLWKGVFMFFCFCFFLVVLRSEWLMARTVTVHTNAGLQVNCNKCCTLHHSRGHGVEWCGAPGTRSRGPVTVSMNAKCEITVVPQNLDNCSSCDCFSACKLAFWLSVFSWNWFCLLIRRQISCQHFRDNCRLCTFLFSLCRKRTRSRRRKLVDKQWKLLFIFNCLAKAKDSSNSATESKQKCHMILKRT